jgi:hypothetical protein
MPVTVLVAPGPLVGQGDSDFSRGPRIAIGRVHRGLLVTRQDMANGRIEEIVIDVDDSAAGITEDGIHTFALQTFQQNFGSGHFQNQVPP